MTGSSSEPDVRRYDLQVHTDVSSCSRAHPRAVVAAARRRGLDGIAVTNHDTVEGYEAVVEHAGEDLDVIRGCEVTTTQGHLLALGVSSSPEPGDPLAVTEAVHDLGGVAVLSHPFDRFREYYDDGLEDLARTVDAVEVVNSRCVLERFNRRARRYAEAHRLPLTGGSDAHYPAEVGRAVTMVPRDRGVLEAIASGSTRALGRGRYLSGHVATKTHDFAPSWVSDRLHRAAPNWL